MAGPWDKYGGGQPSAKPWERYGGQVQASQDTAEPGFLSGVGKSIGKRHDEMHDIVKQYQEGNQSLPETAWQLFGKGGVGTMNDIVGEGFNAVGRGVSSITPEFIKEPIKNVASSAGHYIADSAAGDLAKQAISGYEGFATNHPRAARNIEATANIGGLLASAVPVARAGTVGADALADATAAGAKAVVKAGGKAAEAVSQPVTGGIKNIVRGVKAREFPALEQAAKDMRASSQKAYQHMRSVGADFNADASTRAFGNIQKALAADGPLNPRLHDKVLAVISDMQDAAQSGAFSLEGLDQWRQVLGDIAGNFSDKVNARKAKLLIDAIDDIAEGLSAKDLASGSVSAVDALRYGRSEWARARRFESVADLVKKADGDANKLKRLLTTFANNPKNTRGWSKEAMSALQESARQSSAEGMMKMLGKFGFDLGISTTFGNTALPVLGGVFGGSPVIPAIGTAARYGQKYMARGKAEKLLNVLETEGRRSFDDVLESGALQRNYGGSDLGKFMSQNKGVPAKVFESMTPEDWNKVLKMSPADAREYLKKFGKSL